ncbi:MAG: hypothetical protein KDA72_16055 [Planctomycetales bacterium]|nr:hypothetical protein [Planctomycetales bacterium]
MAVGVISALCESDWQVSVVLVAAGFGGLIICGLAQDGIDNERYCAAVMAGMPAGTAAPIPTKSPYVGLLIFVCFFSVAFLSVYLDSPWPCGIAFIGVVALGVPWAIRKTARRNAIWKQFASRHDLTFDRGNPWDYRENAKITGKHGGRNLRIETVWQDTGSGSRGRKRSEVLIAEVSTKVADISFCIDDLKIPDSAADLAMHLFEFQELKERIEAASPKRISLFEESLTFHFPRVPSTEVELTFYTRLLDNTASTLERFHDASVSFGTK